MSETEEIPPLTESQKTRIRQENREEATLLLRTLQIKKRWIRRKRSLGTIHHKPSDETTRKRT